MAMNSLPDEMRSKFMSTDEMFPELSGSQSVEPVESVQDGNKSVEPTESVSATPPGVEESSTATTSEVSSSLASGA